MVRIVTLTGLLLVLFLSSCALNNPLNTKPVDDKTITSTAINKDDKKRLDDVSSINTPQKLYELRQYDKALMAMLEADPKTLEDPSARKLLWCINDRLVTVQWYLQKSIVELLNGHENKARYHIDEVLKLYPDHKPSLLLKQNLDSIDVKKNHKTPKIPKIFQKKEAINKDPVKEDLQLADYYLLAGNTYFEEGRLDQAKASWLRGLDIVPSHEIITGRLIQLLTNEGLQLFGQGDIEASIEKWEEALELKPDDPETKGYLDKARKAEKKIHSIE